MLDLLKNAASHILLIPSGVHQDAFRTGLQACREVIHVPAPPLLPDRLKTKDWAKRARLVERINVETRWPCPLD
jgi:hypothetical protein